MNRFVFTLGIVALLTTRSMAAPPGGVIVTPVIVIPNKFIGVFVNSVAPDSAIFLLNRGVPSLFQMPNEDSTTLRYRLAQACDRLSSRTSLEDFQFIVNAAIELKYAAGFRLFYKNAVGAYVKTLLYKMNRKPDRELSIVTGTTNRFLELSFYPSGKVMSQSAFIDTSNRRNESWLNRRDKFLKDGKQVSFFYDGKIKSIYHYSLGKKADTAFVYNNEGNLVAQEYWVADSMIRRNTFNVALKNGKTAGAASDSRRKAMLIGIDKYRYPDTPDYTSQSSFPIYGNLAGCRNDVAILKQALTSQRKFAPGNITALEDDGATRMGLLKAFSSFTASLKKGDIVFIHFSGFSGTVEQDGKKDFMFVCRDFNRVAQDPTYKGYITKHELDSIFGRISKAVGTDGQLILSMDTGETDSFARNAKDGTKKQEEEDAAFRGENSKLLFNFIRQDNATVAVLTGTTGKELGFETVGEDKTYGLYSFCLAQTLLDPSVDNTSALFDELSGLMNEKNARQTPGYFANFDIPLFDPVLHSGETAQTVLPELRQSGNAFVLSTGIGSYSSSSPSRLTFNNCVADARAYARFFQDQFQELEGGKQMRSWLLVDSSATRENILRYINETISGSKPDDYFVFNFSGYCKPLSDSNGKRVTYFVPYGLKNIADTNEIKLKGIPLSQLKDLLQLIPANNQLFITEAGSTDAFQKEFIQALIETSPTIAALSNKNRVFIVPRSSGLDRFICNTLPVEHGPLNYYITNLGNELNLFGLFKGGVYAEAVKYAISKTEIDCDYFKSGYFDIFFERNYISDLQYYLPGELMQSRGGIGSSQARSVLSAANSKRYALVMGTNRYDGKPDWNDLNNPTLDAIDIANELKEGYGYSVKLLLDQPVDSFYAHIAWLSRVLQKNDQLIIYVAGHGDFDSMLLDDGFIVCRDSKPVKADPYRNSYIQYSKLEKMVNRLPANQVLMILDVCFGGTFDARVARNQGRDRTTDYTDIGEKAFFAKALARKTRLYLTSGGKDVVPDGYRGKHSPFALRLLQALQGRGGNAKLLTASDLKKFVERLPSGPLIGSFGDDASNTEFILLAN